MRRILVFANGDAPISKAPILQGGELVYCADGGARVARVLGLKVDLVIGDFDSLSADELQEFELSGATIIRHPCDKDQTDLELCLLAARKLSPSEICIYSATGGRLDHFLANLLLLSREEFRPVRCSIVDDQQSIYLLRSGETLNLSAKPEALFSLLPFSALVEGVSLTGAKWTLNNAKLQRGDGRTISNVFVDKTIEISIRQGLLYVILNHA